MITLEEALKRDFHVGFKNKTNAEERQDEETYHLKPNKKQKKGGALSSTLAVKDMSSALSQGAVAEEEPDEERGYDPDFFTESEIDFFKYSKLPKYAPELRAMAKKLDIDITHYPNAKDLRPIVSKKMTEGRDKLGKANYERGQKAIKVKDLVEKNIKKKVITNWKIKKSAAEMKKREDEITFDINWNMKYTPKYLSLSDVNKKKLVDKIYLNDDDISQKDKFNKTLEKYNITLDYDLSIQGKVNDLHDNMSNCKKDGNGDYIIKEKDGTITPIKDRGYFFEFVMLSQHQDIIKKCCSDINQPDFIPSDNQPKLQGLFSVHWNPNSSPLSKWYIYDAFNKFFEIEFKYYEDDTDYVQIQPAKFEGGKSFKPYFCLHEGKYVLYNIWCNSPQYTGFINAENYKEIIFCVFKKGDIYSWSLTDFLTKTKSKDVKILVVTEEKKDKDGKILKDKDGKKLEKDVLGINGENLYTIELIDNGYKKGPFDVHIRNDKTNWLKIPLKDFNKIT